jgi:hypothetical protein
MPMAAAGFTIDTGRMDSILIYCRPRGGEHGESLSAWIERQATQLGDRPGFGQVAVMRLATTNPRGDLGWLLDCKLTQSAGAPSDIVRELLTDMRLVGLQPALFVAQPDAA